MPAGTASAAFKHIDAAMLLQIWRGKDACRAAHAERASTGTQKVSRGYASFRPQNRRAHAAAQRVKQQCDVDPRCMLQQRA